MRRFRRRQTRTVRRLVRVLAALDEHAAAVRPRPERVVRTSFGAAR
jgi:hypothetical protein